jgi:hypothetical protein
VFQLTCTVCGAEYKAVYAKRLYCSPRCKMRAHRARKAAEAAKAAPARAELVGKLERFAPQTAALARELIGTAGDDCTELIVKLVGQAVREIGATMATNGTKAKAEGVPMK